MKREPALSSPQALIVDNHMGCNASCSMCPLSGSSRKRGTMSERHLGMILEQTRDFYASLGSVYVGLHGEPLLDEGLEDKIRRFNALGEPKCVIHTNASMLTELRARALLDAGPAKLIISLESLDPDIYESIRRGLQHAKVLGNILRLLELRDEMGASTSVQIRFIAQRANIAEQESYMQFWRGKVCQDLDEVIVLALHNYLEPLPGITEYGAAPCGMLLTSFVVLSDGTYPLCCLDYEKEYTFGNIETVGMLEAYNSLALAKLREAHRKGRRSSLRACSRCIYPELGEPTDIGERYIERFIKNPAKA